MGNLNYNREKKKIRENKEQFEALSAEHAYALEYSDSLKRLARDYIDAGNIKANWTPFAHEQELDFLCRINRQHRANQAAAMAPLDPESADEHERALAEEFPRLAGFWEMAYSRNREGHWLSDDDGNRKLVRTFNYSRVTPLLGADKQWKPYVREVVNHWLLGSTADIASKPSLK